MPKTTDDGADIIETAQPDALGWEELRSSGLLWLINTTVLHPRGYALALIQLGGSIVGWRLLGDGSEPWQFAENDPGLDGCFRAIKELMP